MAFLKRQGFTNAQAKVMFKAYKTAHTWGEDIFGKSPRQKKFGLRLYEQQMKRLWKKFLMPSLTDRKENTDKHLVKIITPKLVLLMLTFNLSLG